MLTSAEHARIKATAKAQRNARARDRRRRGLTPLVSWACGGWRRCILCGKWCSESGTSGHGLGFRLCEPCFLAREAREEARRAGSVDVGDVDPQRRAA